MPRLSDARRALKEKLLHEQGWRCAICKRPLDRQRSGHLDHNHAVEGFAARAVLCQRCNQGLGLFGDDAERLRRAADYLDRHG